MIFSQYRKLSKRTYYKIVSNSEMFELQHLSKRFVTLHLVASTFLDRNLLLDILDGDIGRYEVISESDFELAEKS